MEYLFDSYSESFSMLLSGCVAGLTRAQRSPRYVHGGAAVVPWRATALQGLTPCRRRIRILQC